MNSEEHGILLDDSSSSLPREINLNNLLGNEVFIDWFLPRLKLIKEIQRWPQEKINEFTEIRLRNLLTHLNNNSVFWRARFNEYFLDLCSPDIFAELLKLPVVDKTTLIKWSDDMLVTDYRAKTSDYYTSGTTGVPLRVRIDEFECIKNEMVYIFEPDAFESRKVDELLRRKFIFLLGRKSTGQYVPYSEYFPFDTFSSIGDKKTREKIYSKILNDSLIYLFAYSSVILELMKYVREDGVKLPVIANLSGEAVSSEEEKFIYETTGIPIIFSYNCKEAGKVGEKCQANIGNNFYHIYRERVLVEIVDDDGQQLENDEEGDIVLTVLDRTTMPIIRYSIGDRGRILSKLCSCGRLSPLLEVQGRKNDNILLPDGSTFNVLLFRPLFLKEIGLKNIIKYQIIQKEIDSLQINFVTPKKISFEKLKIIETILENNLKKKVKVNIREIGHIENYQSGKNKMFVPLGEYKKSNI
ncbi:MAG: hypothetical protein UU33_C0007G0003 [Candidatus Azambacteria bacterium GW2011_GWF1_41_10]|nr:MAG: hypothetical protein UU33_C0007G0003 [Candidatus Azambacteria bacterium GW2011_GWF1_41_10]KKT12968.1 MAG: hypothetical protein UV94_C0036G0005 [Parcubacteria group bacterium GW2011_GWC1_43_30]